MTRELAAFEDYKGWSSAFETRLAEYQTMVDAHNKAIAEFVADKEAELEKKKNDFATTMKEHDELLFQVAPISAQDIDALPTRRAAYSDRTAAFLAKMASLVYIGFEDAEKRNILDGILTHGKVKLVETIHVGETEAMVADTDKFVAVAFRGTTSRLDVRTDIQARLNVAKVTVGGKPVPVHSGFYAAFRKIEDQLRDLLVKTNPLKPIYLTGHSLGGAIALVAAAAFGGDKEIVDRIAAVYTFGAPRVGGPEFPKIVKAPHYRVVNSGDVVPLIPPNWLRGYVHTGTPILLKEGRDAPLKRSSWGSVLFLVVTSVALWPFLRRLRLLEAHNTGLYIKRLQHIANVRGTHT